jgi:hypothetical protein
MSSYQDPFYRIADEILYYLWDPIGVAGDPGTRDEYQSYLPTIVSLIGERKIEAAVEYLDATAVDRMGLDKDTNKSRYIVELLADWKVELDS